MMPNDRMPSISLGLIIPVGAAYDTDHYWPNDAGVWHASVRFDAGGFSCGHIQGSRPPSASWPPPCSWPLTRPTPPLLRLHW